MSAARIAEIEAQIETLSGPELVATDEGTHGGPLTIRVYEELDGSLYTVTRMGGGVVGREDVEEISDADAEAMSHGGHLRRIWHDRAQDRRIEVRRLREEFTRLRDEAAA